MSTHKARVTNLRAGPPNAAGRYVLYWMQHSQRAENNDAFEHAVAWANQLRLPLFVLFVVDPDYPDANARHFTFLFQGLSETIQGIEARNAHFALRKGRPPTVALDASSQAAVVVTDRGYLRHLKAWRQELAEGCRCPIDMVECDVVVPVEIASPKLESAARTIRPKLHRTIGDFLALPERHALKVKAEGLESPDDLDLSDIAAFVEGLECDASVGPADGFIGGLSAARAVLKTFIDRHLRHYGDGRADMVNRNVSHLSPYLHLGMISPVEVYHAVHKSAGHTESGKSFIEEFIIRRELAANYCHYNANYDDWSAIPEWAKATLTDHEDDERAEVLSVEELERGKTSDPYWNAAMREMRVTGYLHNHMRMYWGKQIICYSRTGKEAFQKTTTLNNKYFLDGRDANSYANIAWLFGIHDRGWPVQPIFGKVRSMKPNGLKRKFDIDAYVRWASAL